ncbi:hypothetical protein [Polynucleobacter sp.]|uniref:hypothetical protein n=1 Tax=Polynucleobacter sp. TaxID=2029855 RepID=UPI003F6A3E5B
MKTIEEQKLEAIKQVLRDCYPQTILYPKFTNDAKKILSALKQFEPAQLEVEIEKSVQGKYCVLYGQNSFRLAVLHAFHEKQEALAFCKKYNLKVVGK